MWFTPTSRHVLPSSFELSSANQTSLPGRYQSTNAALCHLYRAPRAQCGHRAHRIRRFHNPAGCVSLQSKKAKNVIHVARFSRRQNTESFSRITGTIYPQRPISEPRRATGIPAVGGDKHQLPCGTLEGIYAELIHLGRSLKFAHLVGT